MNTKSSKIVITPGYESLFLFENKKEKDEYNAQMISYRILSEVERVCEERKLKKKDLAEKIGTSKSYITQLFRGNKSINTTVMAKFEDALEITFSIKAIFNEVAIDQMLSEFKDLQLFAAARRTHVRRFLYPIKEEKATTKETLDILTQHTKKEVA